MSLLVLPDRPLSFGRFTKGLMFIPLSVNIMKCVQTLSNLMVFQETFHPIIYTMSFFWSFVCISLGYFVAFKKFKKKDGSDAFRFNRGARSYGLMLYRGGILLVFVVLVTLLYMVNRGRI